MYPERFWQHLIAASLPHKKAAEFFQTLRPTDQDPTNLFLSWSRLTPEERARLAKLDPAKLQKALENGVRVLTREQFPETLTRLPLQPQALFYRGDPACLHQPKIGIVGTRRATTQGTAIAQKFAEHLALAGTTIVSGGAFGIDIAAHRGALAVNRPTVCVLPAGVDVAQPPRHADDFNKIAHCGCLISHFAIGTPSSPEAPLARNAIVAGLVDALLVVEAPVPSGSLNTATHIANLGKPLFVVPGSINLENYRGSHQLIRDGATLVDHPSQILEDLAIEGIEPIPALISATSPLQNQILHLLQSESMSIEAIALQTGTTTQEILAELTLLELDGLITRHTGGYVLK
jgi:DNA processing protein